MAIQMTIICFLTLTSQSGCVSTASGNVAIGGKEITDSNLLNIQGNGAAKNIGIVLNDTNTSRIYGIQNGSSVFKIFDYTASAERMRIEM